MPSLIKPFTTTAMLSSGCFMLTIPSIDSGSVPFRYPLLVPEVGMLERISEVVGREAGNGRRRHRNAVGRAAERDPCGVAEGDKHARQGADVGRVSC